jgi:prepilin signal peptidase PulO-like enzyme (type II secretory pathway)
MTTDFLNFGFIFIFGLIIGSFLNCLIFRVYKGESLMGRSYCPKCKKKISWYDNIPVLSYVFLKGKCRNCSKKISIQYPLVEFITALLFLLAYVFLNQISLPSDQGVFTLNKEGLLLFRNIVFISVLIVIFIIDLRWYLIFDSVTIPSAIFFFIINYLLGFGFFNILVAGIVGAGFFLLQFIVSKGKWIGGGDIRLGLVMGFAFGRLDLLVLAIMLAYFLGSVIGLGLIAVGKKKFGSKLPFGVFLALSSVFSLFYGEKILTWYLGAIGF